MERLCLLFISMREINAGRIYLARLSIRNALSVSCLLLTAFCLLPSAHAATWTRQPTGTMAWLRAVYFLDQSRGWVAGSGGTLLETIDGGQTWRKLYPFTKD